MSLEGSLETVALPDLLGLLAGTSKSGELRVNGDRSAGRLWLASGRMCGFDVGRARQPLDAVFDLLRAERGTFAFVEGAGSTPANRVPESDAGAELVALLHTAKERLEEWRIIEKTVPSQSATVVLGGGERSEAVTLSPEQWSMVLAIGEGRAVRDVVCRMGLSEFEGTKALKAMIDAGFASLQATPVQKDLRQAPASDTAEAEETSVDARAALRSLLAEVSVGAGADHHSEGSGSSSAAGSGAAADGSGKGPLVKLFTAGRS